MSEPRGRSGGTRSLLAVSLSLCVLAAGAGILAADTESESYDRAVASHSKQDALAFIKAYPSSVLIGYLRQAHPQFQCVLSQFQGVQNELSQFADDATAATKGSAWDTPAHTCLTFMASAAKMTAAAMELHVVIHEHKTIDRGEEVASIRRIEGMLTLSSKVISSSSCSYADNLLFTYSEKLLQLDDRVSDCVAILKVRLPPAAPPITAQPISP
jgi:hypothetical protein